MSESSRWWERGRRGEHVMPAWVGMGMQIRKSFLRKRESRMDEVVALYDRRNVHDDHPGHRCQALESLPCPTRRWHHVSRVRDRADVSAIPEDGQGNRDRGAAPGW